MRKPQNRKARDGRPRERTSRGVVPGEKRTRPQHARRARRAGKAGKKGGSLAKPSGKERAERTKSNQTIGKSKGRARRGSKRKSATKTRKRARAIEPYKDGRMMLANSCRLGAVMFVEGRRDRDCGLQGRTRHWEGANLIECLCCRNKTTGGRCSAGSLAFGYGGGKSDGK